MKGLELSLGPLFHTLTLDTLARPGLTRTETPLKQAEVGCGGGRQKHQGGQEGKGGDGEQLVFLSL